MATLLGPLAHSSAYSIHFLPFEKKYRNATIRSFSEWKVISQAIDQTSSIKEIIFMDVDPYLPLLATRRFRKYKLSVNGILFQPYVHFLHVKGGLSFFVKKILRNFLSQAIPVSANHKIAKLFILNDKAAVDTLNRRLRNVFYFLPDPIEFNMANYDDTFRKKVYTKYGLDMDKKNILLFGCMDDRKNLINIVDALLLLPLPWRSSVHLVIAGPFNDAVRENYIGHIHKHQATLNITYNDGFVAGDEREVLFEGSDLVVMPYVNFYSSSNVLGHAIKHKKKVVASNMGIVGNLVQEHNLGRTVDPHSPEAIKTAIYDLLFQNSLQDYDSEMLKKTFSTASFSKLILSN
jgi:glycosyltransferase involved in cell wall biosynthesis